jgi:hypothetical protein
MVEGFQSLMDIISGDPEFKKVRGMIKEQEVLDKFKLIFPHLSGAVHPVKVQKRLLTLGVENAVLRSEMKFHERDIIAAINEYFKEERVSKIKFQA